MDIDRIRYFTTLAETGNMRKAAELLRISPAALSKAMRILVEETGKTLFIPSGRGILITAEGKAFAKEISKVLVQFDSVFAKSFDSPEEETLRLASFEVFTTHWAGPLIQKHFPRHDLLLHELIPGQIEESIAQGTSDYGITYLPIPHPMIDYIKVSTIQMGIYWKGNRFDKVPFEKIPFIVPISPIQGSPNKVQGLDGWPENDVARRAKYRCAMMETALELCRRGMGAAYLPRFVVELHNRTVKAEYRLEEKPLPSKKIKTEQAVYLLKRKAEPESQTFRKLARALRET